MDAQAIKNDIIRNMGGTTQARDLVEGVERMVIDIVRRELVGLVPAPLQKLADAGAQALENKAVQATESALAKANDQTPNTIDDAPQPQISAGDVASAVGGLIESKLGPTLTSIESVLTKLAAKL